MTSSCRRLPSLAASDEAGDRDDARLVDPGRVAGRDAGELDVGAARPDLLAEHPHRAVGERVVEVDEHEVVAVERLVVVEGDRPAAAVHPVDQVARGQRPAVRQVGHVPGADLLAGHELRLVRDPQRLVDDAGDAVGRDPELVDRLDHAVAKLAQPLALLAQVALDLLQLGAGAGSSASSGTSLEPCLAAEHRLLDLAGEQLAGDADVVLDLHPLARHADEELEVALERARRRLLVALADEVVDQDDRARLAEAVDAAVPLRELCRRERDLEVDDPVAVVLEVDALARRVGGKQDPDRDLAGVGLEASP